MRAEDTGAGGRARARAAPRPSPLRWPAGHERRRFSVTALFERALRRATEAPLMHGNSVVLLVNAPAAYPEMLRLIEAATRRVHLENYIIRGDRVGAQFADALIRRARAGIEVRVLYDWWGSMSTPPAYWNALRDAGCEVRAFGAPSLGHPVSILRRDHRKLLVVDGRTAVIGGICMGDEWLDDHGEGCWRDTAVRVDGPVARELDASFGRMWRRAGGRVEAAGRMATQSPPPPPAGHAVDGVAARAVDGIPFHGRIYRVYQLIAALAESTIYLTGAYPLLPIALRRALASAARGGVDVRLLLAGRSDIPLVNHAGRSQYEALLRAGVRIYEWTGPMLHAKTLVADGHYTLIGSSNLNLWSLQGFFELDLEVQDAAFGRRLERVFLSDLERATEITLAAWRRRSRAQRLTERVAMALLWLPYKIYSV